MTTNRLNVGLVTLVSTCLYQTRRMVRIRKSTSPRVSRTMCMCVCVSLFVCASYIITIFQHVKVESFGMHRLGVTNKSFIVIVRKYSL